MVKGGTKMIETEEQRVYRKCSSEQDVWKLFDVDREMNRWMIEMWYIIWFEIQFWGSNDNWS